ncbi:hypothetical protein SeMB42_g00942 [Synchytrium endobioticum]|uniref:Arrestin C-terminal-like domain-containing protein n=1 Tax=Synchytrium endobioticum TaxID=286115 RepID=A0A507DNJ3_9FUNG|nr:hypothetical protein SeLEV6574_g07722 [Synchytrium endobioticum]TPX53163.1 hypothetical protein SeMB42_g00942 [Synchytrium endobioticum]
MLASGQQPTSPTSSAQPQRQSNNNAEMEAREAAGLTAAARLGPVPLISTANINFKPVSTNIAKSRRLRITVLLDATIFVAGGTIHGRLELTCSTSRSIRLGLIEVQLQGYEEINDRDLAATQSFLSSNIVFQGDNRPPSTAVRGPKQDGFWVANKGKTTFPFAFRLPPDAPSSFDFQTLASLKYVVTGVVHYEEAGAIETMLKSKNAFVVEHWKTTHPNLVDVVVTDEAVGQVFLGGTGQVTLQGAIHKCFYQSGSDVYVEARVKNETRRRVQGVKVQLMRKLVMLQHATKRGPYDTKVIAEPVADAVFREKVNIYDPGEDRSNMLHVHIPPYVRTVSNTALAEVAVSVQVILSTGILSKDIMIELPIDVCHAASASPPRSVDVATNVYPFQYNMVDDQEISPDRTSGEPKHRRNYVSPTRVERPESPPPGRVLPWSDDEEGGYQSPPRPNSLDSASPDRERASGVSPSRTADRVASPGRIPISPTHGPAAPTAYLPATERSRYLTEIPPSQRYRLSRNFSPPRESIILGEYTNDGVYIDKPKDDSPPNGEDPLNNNASPVLLSTSPPPAASSCPLSPSNSTNVVTIRGPRPLPPQPTRSSDNVSSSGQRRQKENDLERRQRDRSGKDSEERHQEETRGRTREKGGRPVSSRILFESSGGNETISDQNTHTTEDQPLKSMSGQASQRAVSPGIQAIIDQMDQIKSRH